LKGKLVLFRTSLLKSHDEVFTNLSEDLDTFGERAKSNERGAASFTLGLHVLLAEFSIVLSGEAESHSGVSQ